ncbi:hypothetical protein HOU00_gp080 [Caulobacter phage CcrPW]|uniref:Uncharacterized protein n=1 Tax=Caulobacter phage CcrPW TaxID=2283271 RepID=A0A385ED36_9CAUD|nr:hypothetical protein HOU00_gp080 [Caulobacter phage CcrPW]AXQ68619.1 hypothetical protein CcrPW_gp080 [Caulobacter phage CcrPW]
MSPSRRKALREAVEHCGVSKIEVEACQREYVLAHDAYNALVTENPPKKRSGTTIENMRRHALAAYEALLDAMRVHSDNLAHIAALRGTSY